jgi:FAD/FMN-containing dehydrogenase
MNDLLAMPGQAQTSAPGTTTARHAAKVARIAAELTACRGDRPVSLKKRAVAHQVPKARDQRRHDQRVDVTDLDEILSIDPERRIAVAESGVTFVDLVAATLKHGLVPIVVPELKTITIGGAVAGCSIESTSFVNGGFHDTCLEYEVITATGEVLTCRPDNEHALVFQMQHGAFGTLGILSKLTFRLMPAKPYVHVSYEKYRTLADYMAAIWRHFQARDVDFMDGIIHSPDLYVLSLGCFVAYAPYTSRYDWLRIYYQSTRTRCEDYLRTEHYLFRYDRGVTNVRPKSLLGRVLFGNLLSSTQWLWL